MATLTDGKKKITFPLPPETIVMSVSGDYASNNVLNTTNPHIRRKASATTHTLRRCLLVSASGKVDQQPFITTIQYWAKQQTKLRFSYHTHILPTCYIKVLTLRVKLWHQGKPVLAEMDIELIESIPDPTDGKAKATATKTPAKAITPREQQKLKDVVRSKLTSPTKRKLIGISGAYDVKVTDDKKVTISNQGKNVTYTYESLIGKLK